MKYKFRAECKDDMDLFIARAGDNIQNLEWKHGQIWGEPIPDVDVTFDSERTLEEVRDIIREVPDSHVML